ncbi:SIR2 family protein [uncultured Treponema sp.]|uniref:SIR2 family protein n=1 Tax=uncultured Treponema sp. TaxID=162155 RepID=UPI0025EEE5E2|nr:SIR2 family protein [uncultured Treponema sp.]
MNILKFEDAKEDLINYFRAKSLLPVIGSGFSMNESALNGTVPSGASFKEHMLKELKYCKQIPENDFPEIESLSFSEICTYYEDDELISKESRLKFYKNNFSNVKLSNIKKQFLEIEWPYIYTLNIDDAIEKNSEYKNIIISNRKVYDDAFENKCVIKLHGDVNDLITYSDSKCLIFTESQYALSIKNNYSLLTKMENDFKNQNIIFIGCSLTDEIDLLTISMLPFSNDSLHPVRRFFICQKEPSYTKRQKLKNHNITDILLVNEFNIIYKELYDIWIESNKINTDELQLFSNIPINKLKQNDNNKEYFYYGKRLHDKKKNIINYPYNFIERELLTEIKSKLDCTNLMLLEGGVLSGKSYLLAAIYKNEKNKKTYYFDSSTKIRNSSFKKLIEKKDCILLFDIGALNREQFDEILNKIETLHQNNLKIIMNVSLNRSDMLGLVKLKLVNHEINEKYISKIRIPNSFNREELKNLNNLLPKINVPVFFEKYSIIDNIIDIHKKMHRGKFSDKELKIESFKELATLIILITQEKIYLYDQVKFGIERECYLLNSKYPEIIEEIETVLIEKDANNLSNYKYILNAKLWLQNELTQFANNVENHEMVREAYLYLVEKIMQLKGGLSMNSRESYREYILFDSINTIFVNKHKENLSLIISIYDKLNQKLSNDYQFLHQYAKGLIMLYLNTSSNTKQNIEYIIKAKDKIIIAESLINKVIENKQLNNEDIYRNTITLAHMQFTEALILCELAKNNKYNNHQIMKNIIEILHSILITSVISDSFMQGFERSSIINEFLLQANKIFSDDKALKIKISNILTYMIKYKKV